MVSSENAKSLLLTIILKVLICSRLKFANNIYEIFFIKFENIMFRRAIFTGLFITVKSK